VLVPGMTQKLVFPYGQQGGVSMAVMIGDKEIGPGRPLTVIAGPCQIESLDHGRMMVAALAEMCDHLGVGLIYKSSYDKANRTSIGTQRGPGIESGLEILHRVRDEFGVPVLTDIHHPEHAALCSQAGIDVIQIPAFLSRQTDLLVAAGESGLAVNIKKGQFMAPADAAKAAAKVASTGNERILLTERGVTHGYNNLVVDMRSLPIMARSGYPVVFDCTHSVQQPSGMGATSGGDRTMVPYLARAAVATGTVDAVFLECHEDPDRAPSDGPNMVTLPRMEPLLRQLRDLHRAVASWQQDVI
jgi:2-dehydro-3-deoxyphosphooctonate aldolase (KDO 8-P synthase)